MKQMVRSRPVSSTVRLVALLGTLTAAVPVAAGPAVDWGDLPGPTKAPSQVIGGYTRGCLDGAQVLPLDGTGYQVMRPSRNRFYGHPDLIEVIRWLGQTAVAQGWPGILVGDLAQARGGPMRSGHASHQTGLDADIWFRPAPPRELSFKEREEISATSFVAANGGALDARRWTEAHSRLLRAAASHPKVERIFVNPAIKQHLCSMSRGDRAWLRKIRPWWGHDDHFHIRLRCPHGSRACSVQAPPPAGDGCDESLAWWMSGEARQELQRRRAAAAKVPSRPVGLPDLPAQCRSVYYGATAAAGSSVGSR